MNSVVLSALEIFPVQLEQMFALIPAGHLHWKPASWDGVPSEMLNPIEQICHVRDIEVLGYQVRFKRLLEEDNPLLASIESYELVESGDYAHQSPSGVFAEIRRDSPGACANRGAAAHRRRRAIAPRRPLRGLWPGDAQEPDLLPVQSRPATPGGLAMAAREDRFGGVAAMTVLYA